MWVCTSMFSTDTLGSHLKLIFVPIGPVTAWRTNQCVLEEPRGEKWSETPIWMPFALLHSFNDTDFESRWKPPRIFWEWMWSFDLKITECFHLLSSVSTKLALGVALLWTARVRTDESSAPQTCEVAFNWLQFNRLVTCKSLWLPNEIGEPVNIPPKLKGDSVACRHPNKERPSQLTLAQSTRLVGVG